MFLDDMKRPFVVMVKNTQITNKAIYMPKSRIFDRTIFCKLCMNDTPWVAT